MALTVSHLFETNTCDQLRLSSPVITNSHGLNCGAISYSMSVGYNTNYPKPSGSDREDHQQIVTAAE